MNEKYRPTEQYIRENREMIGKQIRLFREKKGFSQEELAKIMEVNCVTISKMETGKFAISIDYLVKFAWCLDFSISLLAKQDN